MAIREYGQAFDLDEEQMGDLQDIIRRVDSEYLTWLSARRDREAKAKPKGGRRG